MRVVRSHTIDSIDHPNEDSCAVRELATGTHVVAVFDGHGGNEVATWLASSAGMSTLLGPVETLLVPTGASCAHCHITPSLSRCSRCFSVSYCSQRCQVEHWREEHRVSCVVRGSGLESASGEEMEETEDKAQPSVDSQALKEALLEGFREAEWKCLEDKMTSGACAVVAVILSNKIIAAHLGDCRALLCTASGTAIALTEDHRISNRAEALRVESEGWAEDGRVFGVLQPTRSIGDVDLKLQTPVKLNRRSLRELKRSGGSSPSKSERNGAISGVPSVDVFDIASEHTHLVCATDGLFDKLSNAEVAELVRTTPADEDPAARLCHVARERGVSDDITCVVVNLIQ